jgi:hypothetical protein
VRGSYEISDEVSQLVDRPGWAAVPGGRRGPAWPCARSAGGCQAQRVHRATVTV